MRANEIATRKKHREEPIVQIATNRDHFVKLFLLKDPFWIQI